jgi:hypothetical protein
LDESGELRFVPKKEGGDEREIVLKMSMHDRPAAKIEATYTIYGKETQFTLRKVE